MTLRRTCTLLELVQAVTESARNDEVVVATVAYLLNSGRVRLLGHVCESQNCRTPSGHVGEIKPIGAHQTVRKREQIISTNVISKRY